MSHPTRILDDLFPARILNPEPDAKYLRNLAVSHFDLANSFILNQFNVVATSHSEPILAATAAQNAVVFLLLDAFIFEIVRLYRVIGRNVEMKDVDIEIERSFKKCARKLVPYRDFLEHREDPGSVGRKSFPKNQRKIFSDGAYVFMSQPSVFVRSHDNIFIGEVDLVEIYKLARRLFPYEKPDDSDFTP